MFSEIAIEGTVRQMVVEIKKELELAKTPEARLALKKIGNFALTLFEWSSPDWADEYTQLFRE